MVSPLSVRLQHLRYSEHECQGICINKTESQTFLSLSFPTRSCCYNHHNASHHVQPVRTKLITAYDITTRRQVFHVPGPSESTWGGKLYQKCCCSYHWVRCLQNFSDDLESCPNVSEMKSLTARPWIVTHTVSHITVSNMESTCTRMSSCHPAGVNGSSACLPGNV